MSKCKYISYTGTDTVVYLNTIFKPPTGIQDTTLNCIWDKSYSTESDIDKWIDKIKADLEAIEKMIQKQKHLLEGNKDE